MNMMSRPLIQDLVRSAIASDGERMKIAAEGARQLGMAEGASKTAAPNEPEVVSTDFAMKLASAIEFVTPEIVKSASMPLELPAGVTFSNQKGSPPGPGQQGHGKQQPPLNPPMEAAHPGGPKNHLQTTADHYVHGTQELAVTGAGRGHGHKTASILAKLAGQKEAAFPVEDAKDGKVRDRVGSKGVPAVSKEKSKSDARQVAREKDEGKKVKDIETGETKKKASAMTPVDYFLAQTKQAEDAINPARISAGKAEPPGTSAAGEHGGTPVAGAPRGPTELLSSTERVINYKRNQAYSPRKGELKAYFNEPALSGANDTTLQQAFAHTGEAGTKFASAGGTVKTAAARALLNKLAAAAGKQA